jgi:hypothetical protein
LAIQVVENNSLRGRSESRELSLSEAWVLHREATVVNRRYTQNPLNERYRLGLLKTLLRVSQQPKSVPKLLNVRSPQALKIVGIAALVPFQQPRMFTTVRCPTLVNVAGYH